MGTTYKGYGGVDYLTEREAEISKMVAGQPHGQCSDAYGTYSSRAERAEKQYDREHPEPFSIW